MRAYRTIREQKGISSNIVFQHSVAIRPASLYERLCERQGCVDPTPKVCLLRYPIAKTTYQDAIKEPIRRVSLVIALNRNRLKSAEIEALEGYEVPRIPFHPSRCLAQDRSDQGRIYS